ncbi:MAG: class I SAM-dependent methyltransferase [Chloroflexota bacterium]
MRSTDWDERYASSEYVWTVSVNQFVAEHLAGLKAATAIDLGAGEGRNAVWLAQRGWRVIAVDFSETGLAKGRRLADDHDVADLIEFVRADALTYEPASPVDLVVLSYLQLPIREQQAVLGQAATWLRSGGTVFVIAHDRRNVDNGYGGPSSQAVCYDVDRTVAALVGLDVAKAEVAERRVDTPEGVRTALDTLVIATRPG